MAYKQSIRRFRDWYTTLLRLYPKPYRERFGEEMEQTFNDLCRERGETEDGLFGFVLWMFVETSAGIIKENITMQKNIIRLALVTGLILLIPLVLTLLGSGVDGEGWHWTLGDFIFMGTLIFGTGLAYQVVARKAAGNTAYKVAVGIALGTAFLLVWVNAAAGIIGDSNNDANTMYFGVLAVGIVGAFIARFAPLGMARVLFATALAQFLVPMVALIIPSDFSPYDFRPGVVPVMGLNFCFVLLFVGSALLFRRASASGHDVELRA